MLLHIAHIITTVVLLIAVAMACASLGLSFAHLRGTNPPAPAPYPYSEYSTELLPFQRCSYTTVNTGLPASYSYLTTSTCVSWSDYWSNNTLYCPTIGGSGSVTTSTMLGYMRTAQAGGILFMIATIAQTAVFVLWAFGVIKPWFAVAPSFLLGVLGFILSVALWGTMYNVCDHDYCSTTKAAVTAKTYLQSTECWLADGVRVQISAFILFFFSPIPMLVFKRPSDEVAEPTKEEPGQVQPIDDVTKTTAPFPDAEKV